MRGGETRLRNARTFVEQNQLVHQQTKKILDRADTTSQSGALQNRSVLSHNELNPAQLQRMASQVNPVQGSGQKRDDAQLLALAQMRQRENNTV